MKIRIIAQAIIGVFDKVSTRPNYTSWCWKGNASPIAYVILHVIYVARLLSVLQWGKYFYRLIKKYHGSDLQTKWSTNVDTDKPSQRINVPAYFVELYFLIWCLFLFLFPKESCIVKWFSYYFMVESCFWLIYYFFFRRFFEEQYAIMHTLEYIVLLPILIINQTRCISIISHISFQTAIGTLFFPSQNNSIFIILLSVLYTAVIFGIFLSNLPIEHVKEKGNYRYNMTILGNGHIVQERLKFAIGRVSPSKHVAVLDIEKPERNYEIVGNAKFNYFQISEASLKSIFASNVLWIATPSYVHLSYLNKYIYNVFIAIEKPLICNKSEYAILIKLRQSSLWQKVFCLSYYYLEKALPLTYLYNPLTFYEDYLDFGGGKRENIFTLFDQLGRLNSIKLEIHEPADNREWVESTKYGGHVFETFIHLAVIARMVVPNESEWQNITPRWTIRNKQQHYTSYIKCEGETQSGAVSFALEMEKFSSSKKRGGILIFDNGTIVVDFDGQSVEISLNNHVSTGGIRSCRVCNKKIRKDNTEEFIEARYDIQLDMVRRCFEENILPSMVDGSDLQISTLQWLFDQSPYWHSANL